MLLNEIEKGRIRKTEMERGRKMKDHQCIIGEWLDYEDTELITFKDLIQKVKENNNTFDYGLKTYGEYFMNGLMKELKLKDYFDNRKNINLNKFNYCPYCGEKINWKKLKEENK